MTRILIEEWTGGPNATNARVSFDGGPVYPVTVIPPFTPAQEQLLAWYFEEYLNFPLINETYASKAAASIVTYGEQLFAQVFADRRAYAAYVQYKSAGINTLHFEIAGSFTFHDLHWEALKDPDLPHPFVLDTTMVRKNLEPAPAVAMVRPSPTINILVVTARPDGRKDVNYRTISRPMIEALRQANLKVRIDLVRPGTYMALSQHLEATTDAHRAGYYHVIHFDAHGAVLPYEQLRQGREANRFIFQDRSGYDRPDIKPYPGQRAFLFLEAAETGKSEPVAATELAKLLVKHQIPVALLNACQSGKIPQGDEDEAPAEVEAQAQAATSSPEQRESSLGLHLMQAGVQVVLAMSYSVTVTAARLLMTALYQHLFAKEPLAIAIRASRIALADHKAREATFKRQIDLEDWLLPVVYQNQEVQLAVGPFTPDEEQRYYEQEARRYQEPETSYGFFGRDLDVLEIERNLLTRHNMLLLRGMGGAGKTTLLRHLGSWWQTTHLVEQVFYFGYDAQAWGRQQLMRAMAEQLVGKDGYRREFQPLSPEAQQVKLTSLLRSRRHLLILDNLESITGTHFAIRHTLSSKEQEALRRLLADLAGGKTLVLLGSRSDEAWLARGTFRDQVYELGGLDPEAASQLTEQILERCKATRYRQDSDLLHLLTLLDGFPLALEIVLSNLAHHTPAEILAALHTGDVSIDSKVGRTRTESILACIDYSHSNLSPQAQAILLCLAPFTSVVDSAIIDLYTQLLQQHAPFATLFSEAWREVLREAAQWGLLTPDKQLSRYLRLQPVLPYFLQNRLHAPDQQEKRVAIEAAFVELYDQLGYTFFTLQQSKDPQERRIAQIMIQFEYENMHNALRLALAGQRSVLGPYRALDEYLDRMQEPQRALELAQMVLAGLQHYPEHLLRKSYAGEMVAVSGNAALYYLKMKRYQEAEGRYQQALQAQQQRQDIDEVTRRHGSATFLHQLGAVAQQQRQWRQAESYYQQALHIYEEYQDRHSQADTLHQLGRVAQEQRQWEQAEHYYQRALAIDEEYQDRHSQARTLHQLGRVAQEQRQWEQAEHYYQQALRIFEEYQDRHSQARTYGQLGNMAQEQRQWEQTEHYYQQALAIYEEYQDRYAQAGTLHNLGIVAQEQRQWEQAESYYQQALAIYEEYQDRHAQARTLHQLGRVAQQQRQWEQAESYYQQALRIFEEYQDRYAQAGTLHNLGSVAQEQRQWEQGRAYLLQALKIFHGSQDTYSFTIVLHNLARLWQESDDRQLPSAVASLVGMKVDEVELAFRQVLDQEKS
jgi:tetratricopeptide (TPR) repeat protein